jgi:hypothetical protein
LLNIESSQENLSPHFRSTWEKDFAALLAEHSEVGSDEESLVAPQQAFSPFRPRQTVEEPKVRQGTGGEPFSISSKLSHTVQILQLSLCLNGSVAEPRSV